MKLPRSSSPEDRESSREAGEAFLQCLRQSGSPIAGAGSPRVLRASLTPPLATAMGIARRAGQLRGGLENIESHLQREEAGLEAVAVRTRVPRPDGSVSRLLLVTNDGSERFYRQCAALLERYGHRLVGVYLDVPGQVLGERFFGQGAAVKAVLVSRKDFVVRVVQTLVSDGRPKPSA